MSAITVEPIVVWGDSPKTVIFTESVKTRADTPQVDPLSPSESDSETQRLHEARTEQQRLLAAQASRAGISIAPEPSGRFVARDPRTPHVIQLVTPLSCTCKGFEIFRRCEHNALVRRELGLIGGK
jgi:hypothetical protein